MDFYCITFIVYYLQVSHEAIFTVNIKVVWRKSVRMLTIHLHTNFKISDLSDSVIIAT